MACLLFFPFLVRNSHDRWEQIFQKQSSTSRPIRPLGNLFSMLSILSISLRNISRHSSKMQDHRRGLQSIYCTTPQQPGLDTPTVMTYMPTVIPCYFFPIKDQQDDKMTIKNRHKQTKNCRLGSFWLITAVTDLYLSWCRWIRPMGTKERTCRTYWCDRFLTNNHPKNKQIYANLSIIQLSWQFGIISNWLSCIYIHVFLV